jgi:hypothetical protein
LRSPRPRPVNYNPIDGDDLDTTGINRVCELARKAVQLDPDYSDFVPPSACESFLSDRF